MKELTVNGLSILLINDEQSSEKNWILIDDGRENIIVNGVAQESIDRVKRMAEDEMGFYYKIKYNGTISYSKEKPFF